MWLRRAFFHWLLPSAFLLPLWLVIGWGVFNASGWVFLWVLFIAVPSVLLGQLVLTLLVRARGTVRHGRAVSWWDVLVFGVWHALTVIVGLYPQGAFWPLLVAAVVAFLGVFWVSLWQLFREARGSIVFTGAADRAAFLREATRPGRTRPDTEVFIVEETRSAER